MFNCGLFERVINQEKYGKLDGGGEQQENTEALQSISSSMLLLVGYRTPIKAFAASIILQHQNDSAMNTEKFRPQRTSITAEQVEHIDDHTRPKSHARSPSSEQVW